MPFLFCKNAKWPRSNPNVAIVAMGGKVCDPYDDATSDAKKAEPNLGRPFFCRP
jgi:hypothetical protein